MGTPQSVAESTGFDPDDGDVTPPDELEAALEQMGDAGGFVRIYKRPPEGGPLAIAEKVAIGSFDLFTVAKRWGGGEFRFEFCNPKGRAVRNATRVLLEPPEQPTTDSSDDLHELRILLETSRREHMEFMSKLLNTVLANQSSAGPAGGASLQDFAAIMREAREAAAATQTPADAMRELITLGIDLRNNASGDGSGEDGSMFEKLAPQVLDLITKLSKPTNDATALPTVAGVNPDLAAVVREFSPKIIAEAQSGHDPFAWGSFIAERTPETWLPHLNYICELSPVERRELFARLDPRVTPYMAWLDSAAEGVRDVLSPTGENESAEADPDGARGAGEGANPPADA